MVPTEQKGEREMRKTLFHGNKKKAECGSSVLLALLVLFCLSLCITALSSYLGLRYKRILAEKAGLEKSMERIPAGEKSNVID